MYSLCEIELFSDSKYLVKEILKLLNRIDKQKELMNQPPRPGTMICIIMIIRHPGHPSFKRRGNFNSSILQLNNNQVCDYCQNDCSLTIPSLTNQTPQTTHNPETNIYRLKDTCLYSSRSMVLQSRVLVLHDVAPVGSAGFL